MRDAQSARQLGKGNYLAGILVLLVFGVPAGYATFFAWTEVNLEHRLTVEGVQAKGTVLTTKTTSAKSRSGRNIQHWVRYSFEEGGRTFTNEVRVDRHYLAQPGATIPILYLPDHPEANLPVARGLFNVLVFGCLFAGGITLLCGFVIVAMTVKLIRGGYDAPASLVTDGSRGGAGNGPRAALAALRATRNGDLFRCEGTFTAKAARLWHELVLDVDIREVSSGFAAAHRCLLFYSLVIRDVSGRELLRERRSFRPFIAFMALLRSEDWRTPVWSLIRSAGWRVSLPWGERVSNRHTGEVVLAQFSLPAPGTYAVALDFPVLESVSKGGGRSEATVNRLELRVLEGASEPDAGDRPYRRVALPAPPFEETPRQLGTPPAAYVNALGVLLVVLTVLVGLYLFAWQPSPSHVRETVSRAGLIAAVRAGEAEKVASLLAAGVDPRERERGWTALLWAAYSGREDIVTALLDAGADLEARDPTGYTPLTWAAQRGHARVVSLLLDRGANVDAKDSSLRTPLMCAAWTGQAEVVRVLLARGADATARTRGGKTARDYAAMEHHQEVLDLLRVPAEREVQ